LIQAVERAAKIIRIVAENADGIRLCDLARACDLKRNTLYNLADTLVKEDMLEKTEDARYLLGAMLTGLADGQNRNKYMPRLETELGNLHAKYDDTSIYYSELGEADIVGILHFPPGNPGKAKRLEGNTLNPYATVSGLLFFAFAPEEKMEDVRFRNPFEYHGLNAWGNFEKFMKNVETVRKRGYSETPSLTTKTELKIGVPVWDGQDNIAGAVAFHMRKLNAHVHRNVIHDVLETVRKIRKY